IVSKASDDLPEPERPVNTTSRSRGISRSTFLRLCSRAPRMEITRRSAGEGADVLPISWRRGILDILWGFAADIGASPARLKRFAGKNKNVSRTVYKATAIRLAAIIRPSC